MMPTTIESCMTTVTERLKAAGVEQPRRESRLLIAHVLGVDPATVAGHPEYPVPDRDRLFEMAECRARGEPMAQILGRREFWSLEFLVTADTLDPRPDSETVVEAALDAVSDRRGEPLTVLDLGTGTGCLLLAALSELPRAEGVGVDLSWAAARVARENAQRLGLGERCRIVVGDWTDPIDGRFDLILANPPYIPRGEIAALQPEISLFEPRLALDGGPDGLDAYRRLATDLRRLLRPGGVILLEVGDGQSAPVAQVMNAAGFSTGAFRTDLGGVERCVICDCSLDVNQKKRVGSEA